MIDKKIQKIIIEGLQDTSSIKKNILPGIFAVFKKYRNYFLALIAIIGVLLVLGIWLIWFLISGLFTTVLPTEMPNIPDATNGITKIQEVGINGILEEPLKFIQDLWLGKDGK